MAFKRLITLLTLFVGFTTTANAQQRKQTLRRSAVQSVNPILPHSQRVAPIQATQQAVEDLIKDDLLGGGCIEIRNVNGSSAIENGTFAQIGRFQKDKNLDIGFDSGIILSTGHVISAQGPNVSDGGSGSPNTQDASTAFAGLQSDVDIPNSDDAAVIEFEFKPTGDFISFNYIFASEEYDEWVCGDVNDRFSFFIKKAGTADPLENIAIIPGSTLPVAINSVNNGTIGSFADGTCTNAGESLLFSSLYNSNPRESANLRYDGFTDIFTASKGQLDPCEWYYFKIVIADVGDGEFDSAVFLESNSFSDGSPVTIDPVGTVPGTGDAIEGCKDGYFLFSRGPNNDNTLPYTVDFSIAGTATEGTDYQNIVRSVTIPPAKDTLHLNIYPIVDTNNTEGDETIILETTNVTCGCSLLPIFSTVTIKEYEQAITNLPVEICDGQTHTLPDGITVVNTTGNYETILPRIENPICDSIIVTNLTVNPLPTANSAELRECSNVNSAGFDLTAADVTVGNGVMGMNITYHASQADADTGNAPLASPFNSMSVKIYARVENQMTACVSTNEVELFVDANPIANPIAKWPVCDTDNNDTFDFDLSTKDNEILGTQLPGDFTITYYTSQANADAGMPNIPGTFTNTSNPQEIFARIENNTSRCYATTSFELEIFDTPVANQPAKWQVCDTDNDGFFDFDLTTRDVEVLNGQDAADYTITYHTSQAEAGAGTGALPSPHQNVGNPQTIYVRIENKQRAICSNTTSFEIEVNPSPTIQTPAKWNQCDNDNDGTFAFDLTTQDDTVLDGLSAADYTVKYFESEAEADANNNEIVGAYPNLGNPQTIWVRLHNNMNVTCYSKTSFEIEVFNTPTATTPTKQNVCDTNNDGQVSWDFTLLNTDILNGQSAAEFDVRYYLTENDADNRANEITTAYLNSIPLETIWVIVENKGFTMCDAKTSFEIEVFNTPTATAPTKQSVCDTNNDGQVSWDFTLLNTAVLNGQSTALFDVRYYTTENDADNRANEITTAYINNIPLETIWVIVENKSFTMCEAKTSFEIEVFNTPNAVDVPIDIPTCSANANADFDLTAVQLAMADNVPGMNVTFYPTLADAQAQSNAIINPANFISPTALVYGVVSDPANNNCSDIGEVQLTVLDNPVIRNQTIKECELEDMPLESNFDLKSVEQAIINNAQNVTVTYHESLVDANAGTSPILNPANYQSVTKLVYARSLANYNGNPCHSVSEIALTVNLLPIALDDTYTLCSDQPTAVFDLASRIPVITDGMANTVSFFPTEADARNNTIASIIASPFTASTATLWARVENPVTNCVAYSTLDLAVVREAELDEILEMTTCIKLGQSTFDLLVKKNVLELQYPNYNFTFHATEEDAEGNINALPNHFVSGPTTIYARVQTQNSICFEVEMMELKVDAVPEDDKGEHIVCTAIGFTLPNGERVFQPGQYDRTIQDPVTGCDILAKTTLMLGTIRFPTAFTPNINGENDMFRAMPGDECAIAVTQFEMMVFNRWGEKVFTSNNYTVGWDGTFNGYSAPAGVYIWHVTYDFDGLTVEQKGAVNLIR